MATSVGELEEWYNEADIVHSEWRIKAQEDWAFYNGDQWDENVKTKLEQQKRPVLTLNYLRSLIRLLVGYEQRTRYNMKVYPVGEGSDDIKADIYTKLMHKIERDTRLQYTASDVGKHGLIMGRGWFKIYIDRSYNLLGDVVIESDDPYYIKVDPYARRLDMLDHRYLFVEHWYPKRQVERLYPELNVADLQLSKDNFRRQSGIDLYKIMECWYREYQVEKLLINKNNYDVFTVKDETDEELQTYVDSGQYTLVKRKIPQVRYVVLSGWEILEQGNSPFNSPFYPYVLYTPEFLPLFGANNPDWVGLIRDLKDPQKEINKRRSEWLDILIRSINTGWITTKNNILNKNDMKRLSTSPGTVIEVRDFNQIREKRSEAPHPALFTTGQQAVEDLRYISGINTAQLGFSLGTRESGKSLLVKQQSGSITLTPYQDNLQLARLVLAKLILSAIPQVYNASRIARVISPTGDINGLPPEVLQSLEEILSDEEITRYDVALADVPSTPTARVAAFAELREIIGMMAQLGMPPSPQLIEELINASDISQKRDVIRGIQEQVQQAQQAQQQAQQMQQQAAILKGQ